MLKERSTHTRYVFVDVVDFTKKGTGEQTKIVRALNNIVSAAIRDHGLPEDDRHLLYLPTGDGICIALKGIDTVEPPLEASYNVHLRLALSIIRGVHEHSESGDAEEKPRFDVRIGVNEDEDNEVIDINGRPNMAGKGINDAQRIMSLAEANQIVVGLMVYQKLSGRDEYKARLPEAFYRFEATVKHGTTIAAYQYVADGHPGLKTDRREAQRKGDITKSIRSATDCGLRRVYHSRGEPTLRERVLQDIDRAGRRVWLMAACLSEEIDFTGDLLPRLERKLAGGVEVRILLLDALRSPALFRTFLESDVKDLRRIIHPAHSAVNAAENYCDQLLYRSFKDRYKDLMESKADFSAAVRFYGHTPTSWLVIADDAAYFQPYTYGGNVGPARKKTIGPLMPVFKFEPREGAESDTSAATDTFTILEDHFAKLWLTTDIDMFHIGARIENRTRLLEMMFLKRNPWLNYAYDALYAIREEGREPKQDGKDDRRHPRRPCESKPSPEPTVCWEEGGQVIQGKFAIKDFAHGSIRLQDKPGMNRFGVKLPAEGAAVTIEFPPPRPRAFGAPAPPTEHLIREFMEPSGGRFEVVWVNADSHEFALRATPDAPRDAP